MAATYSRSTVSTLFPFRFQTVILFLQWVIMLPFLRNTYALDSGEAEALISIANGFHNDSGALRNWTRENIHRVCSDWQGVQCGSSGHVVEIDLSFQGLQGIISPQIGLLSDLQVLNLSFNAQLSANVPSSIGLILGLKKLYLGGTNLTGALPDSVGQLHELEELVISGLAVSGTFPSPILQLHKLRILNLDDCNITGNIPDLSNLTALTHLDLYENQLSGAIPSSLGNLKTLTYLDLSVNKLSGTIPSSLGQLHALTDLYLYSNQLSGRIPSSLGNCSFLEVLRLATNMLQGEIPDFFGNMPNLRKLLLDNNKFNGSLPGSLERCNSLEWLVTGNNSLTGMNELPLQFMDLTLRLAGNFPRVNSTNLEVFCVRDNDLSGPVPHWNSTLRLRVLDLGGNDFSGNIPNWIWNCPQLQVIDLYNNRFQGQLPSYFGNLLTFIHPNTSVESIKTYELVLHVKGGNYRYKYLLQAITLLDLSGNRLEGIVPRTIGQLRGLKYLRLSGNSFTGGIPDSIAQMPELEELNLSHNHFQGSIPGSLGSLTKLAVFDVSFNSLSGPIPLNGQLITFNSSSFVGNLELCGKPLTQNCSAVLPPATTTEANGYWPWWNDNVSSVTFSVAAFLGFVWGLVVVLYLQ